MFRHHKYCVVEVSGLLLGYEAPHGVLTLYLLDGAANLAQSRDGQKLRVCDPEFVEFVRLNASQRDGSACRHELEARITGTVDMDGKEVQLLGVSDAIMKDGDRVLRYEPRT